MTKPETSQDKQLDAEAGLDEATLDGVVGGAQASVKSDSDDADKQSGDDAQDANRFANNRLASGRFA